MPLFIAENKEAKISWENSSGFIDYGNPIWSTNKGIVNGQD